MIYRIIQSLYDKFNERVLIEFKSQIHAEFRMLRKWDDGIHV